MEKSFFDRQCGRFGRFFSIYVTSNKSDFQVGIAFVVHINEFDCHYDKLHRPTQVRIINRKIKTKK